MESAFGIEHGEIAKSYKKLAPKLNRSGSFTARETDTLQDRQKVNYRQWRMKAGGLRNSVNPNNWKVEDAKYGVTPSEQTLAVRELGRQRAHEKARSLKQGSQAMVTGHANNQKRNRKLP